MKQVDKATLEQIKKNVFWAAHSAIGDWDSYPWHVNRGQITTGWSKSSQALSIDVFGTLRAFTNQAARDAVMNSIAMPLGLAQNDTWHLDLEWEDERNLLKEKRPTQVDVKAQTKDHLLMLECKFTEPDGGPCSQTSKLNGRVQCGGRSMLPAWLHKGTHRQVTWGIPGIQSRP